MFSLKDATARRIVSALNNDYWEHVTIAPNNPFSLFPTELINELVQMYITLTSQKLSHRQLKPLLTSGRLTCFRLTDVCLETCSFIAILDYLTVSGALLTEVVITRVHCMDVYAKTSSTLSCSRAIEEFLAVAPQLELFNTDIMFDISALRHATCLKCLDLNFFPKQQITDLLPTHTNSRLQHLAIYEDSRHIISPSDMADLLQRCPELVTLENNVALALDCLHRHEAEAGQIRCQYNLSRLVLGSGYLDPTLAPATVSSVLIAVNACPRMRDLDLLVDDEEAIFALETASSLETLDIQWADVKRGNFHGAVLFLLQILGSHLSQLGLTNFDKIDFAAVATFCPFLTCLKVEFEDEYQCFPPPSSWLPNLTILRLECQHERGLPLAVLQSLLTNCHQLRRLHIEGATNLTDNELQIIYRKNQLKYLKNMTIINCCLSAEGLQTLVTNHTALEVLEFSSLLINSGEAFSIIHTLKPQLQLAL
ncbi:uncharacterized protein LOC106475268 [Limulus polyphemus]|uniref:Uncharacterized protein LOC106475268 n=1 Tax=Limulus polyphemus TaxID=6850 RepID=A0ABM1BZ45_LIMPO|nr:uncharacterized protein LOC106475268 [Limulus polyphemus]